MSDNENSNNNNDSSTKRPTVENAGHKIGRREALAATGAMVFGLAALGPRRAMGQPSGCSGESGFYFPEGFDVINPEGQQLASSFLDDPDSFLASKCLNYETMRCPDAVHEAMARGEAFRDPALALLPIENADDVSALRGLAETHFGSDFEVTAIPYGLRFQERAVDVASGTATGSATVTFLDADADTDT